MVTWGAMLGSLTGELNEGEVDTFLDLISGGSGFDRNAPDAGDTIIRVARKLGPVSQYLRKVILDEYRRPSEIEFARRMVFRLVSMREYIVDGLEIGIVSMPGSEPSPTVSPSPWRECSGGPSRTCSGPTTEVRCVTTTSLP